MVRISLLDNPEAVGPLLREYRLQNQITQKAAAKAIGVSVATVGRIERGRMPRMWSTFRKVCQYIGLTHWEIDGEVIHLDPLPKGE